jgi:hypothetical protein
MKKRIFLFSLAVFSLTSLMAQNVIDKEVEKAVKGLAGVVLSPLNITIKEITLDGTNDMTDRFSGVLFDMVKHHAVENSNSMFIVIEDTKTQRGPKDPNETAKGIISGKYSIMGKNVKVILELKIDEKVRSSKNFTVPVSVVEEMGISLLPEPIKTQKEAEKQDKNIAVITGTDKPVKTQSAKKIKIDAWFDSKLGSRLYMHREPLEITVMADFDCYFKIFHIDVNNQFKMIYPASGNDNNSLRANVSRVVFDNPNSRYVFYGPYGAETLVIVASPVQFPNIEKEYNQPWKPATKETFNTAISGASEARYTITILKPSEEYEYTKPQNMKETYQAIQDDTAKQKGYFEGNETSGFYIVDNIRGSYRISRESPDKIQFTSYYLDAINGFSNRGRFTRGTPFEFSFAKPQNITQAIETVRSGIESKGGIFNGDEQQGNFKASGIAGQYIVSDLVNVTISEKPFVVPNLLIANEVKNFFGVR